MAGQAGCRASCAAPDSKTSRKASRKASRATTMRSWAPDARQLQEIYRFIYRAVGNREEAEELTERACLQALKAPSDACACQAMEIVLFQTAYLVVTEYLRGFYHGSSSPVSDELDDLIAGQVASAAQYLNQPDEADRVQRILAQLPVREGALLTSRLLNNASLAEAAASLHLTLGDALALQWSALTAAAQAAAREKVSPSISPTGAPS